MEIWKDIKGYEGLYQISNYGNVKSLRFINRTIDKKRARILKPQLRNNYYIIHLVKNGKRKQFSIHRLVAQEFIENPNNYTIVNHIDYNTLNNNANNLEWCTQKQNIEHSKCHMVGKIHHIKSSDLYGIIFRNRGKKYELSLKRKYYGRFETLEEAQKKRKEILDELGISI